jgi:hypothetical protein
MFTRTHNFLCKAVFTALLSILGLGSAYSCDLSSFAVSSIVPMGLDTAVNFTVCVGAGRTGALLGADQSTNTFSIQFYGTLPGTNIQSFSPGSVVSVVGGCTMPGLNLGADPFFGSIASISYLDPGYYGLHIPCSSQPFACINSTPLCGGVHTQCVNFSVVFNRMPDSMCVYGIEGGGNPLGGCSCASMGSTLRQSLLGLIWGDIRALAQPDHIRVTWQSLQEFNMGVHHLERQVNGDEFVELTTRQGAGSNQEPVEYAFLDSRDGLQGEVKYRVKFVDQNGETDYSSIVAVQLPITRRFSFQGIAPLPAKDLVHASLWTMEASQLNWSLIDVTGKTVDNGNDQLPAGQSKFALDLTQLHAGTYYLQCRVGNERVTRKVVKL